MKKFIDRLFGRNTAKNAVKEKSIDDILGLSNDTTIVIEIGKKLWRKSKNDKNLESLNEYEKNVLYLEMLEGQVNNGGFDQYFFNSSGEYSQETSNALQEIGALKMLEILEQAIKVFPSLPIPKDTETRRELMQDLPKEINQKLNELDQNFYVNAENSENLVIEYVKKNKKYFE